MSNPNIKNWGFGTRPKEVDNEYRSRSKGVPKTIIWTKEKCINELNDCLDAFKIILRENEKLSLDSPAKLKQESIRDLNTMMNRILDFMKYLYPQTQTNVNVNVDATSDKVIERLKNWKAEQVIEFIPNPTAIPTNVQE